MPCSVDKSNKITIYGVDSDVLIDDSQEVKFQISKFTLPSIAYSSSDFVWTVSIYRWGTRSLIAKYTTSTGPATLSPGEVKLLSWSPNSLISTTDIVESMSLYMKLNFTTSHSIPANGKVLLTLDAVDITRNW